MVLTPCLSGLPVVLDDGCQYRVRWRPHWKGFGRLILNHDEIRLTERAHYHMQLSGYFSELVDFPGIRFAFTNRLADTWYNQAYDIDWTHRSDADLGAVIAQRCASRDRAACVYISPANKPKNIATVLKQSGMVPFEDEAWMFFPMTSTLSESNESITIRDVGTNDGLSDFCEVYRHGLPGPEVENYIHAARDGFRYAPAGVDVRYLVAYIDGQPAGIMSVLSALGCSGIYNVATVPQFRRKGVARSLARHAVQIAHAYASKYLFLQTVSGDESEHAFSRLGFTTAYTRIGYTTPDVVASLTHG